MVIANLDLGPMFRDRPQAQGDVLVLPWWDHTPESDRIRLREVAEAAPLPQRGLIIRQSHWLRSEQASPLYWAPWTLSEQTVGTLVVPPFSTAQMVHRPQGHPVEHDRLRLGPSIYYVVLQQGYSGPVD
jgi:hypothetical protein